MTPRVVPFPRSGASAAADACRAELLNDISACVDQVLALLDLPAAEQDLRRLHHVNPRGFVTIARLMHTFLEAADA